MFLRNCWYVAGWTRDVQGDAVVARKIIGDRVVLYRQPSGRLVALQDRCPHRHAPLSLGRIEGDTLRCMYHGLRFGADGRCVEVPGQDTIPAKACVRSYPVREAGCWIWVWMGDPEQADAALIPPGLVGHDDPAWVLGGESLSYQANYELINDNLLDLSHISFVHRNTLARQSLQWGETRPDTRELPRGVRVERWLRDDTAPAHCAPPPGERFDRWTWYDYLAPGVFLLQSEYHAPGTAQAAGLRRPDGPRPRYVNLTQQAVTPVDERHTIYYFTAGHRPEDGYAGRTSLQVAAVVKAFEEDRTVIEAQQKVIDELPPVPMVPTGADGAVTRFRRVMQRLMAEEAAS
ncbi:MAG: aromatic ring-hydroxylating dioxygenase subunit alpha [Ramlibacter sp.]|nr:aromatic ring-hydroxylating dioxygenase subunit alpha [Ramlibacter sp.]